MHFHLASREIPLLALGRNLRHRVRVRRNPGILLPVHDEVIKDCGDR